MAGRWRAPHLISSAVPPYAAPASKGRFISTTDRRLDLYLEVTTDSVANENDFTLCLTVFVRQQLHEVKKMRLECWCHVRRKRPRRGTV